MKSLKNVANVFQGLKARGNVEDWLGKVEEAMFNSLRRLVKESIRDFERREREEWVTLHASQVSDWSIVYFVVTSHLIGRSLLDSFVKRPLIGRGLYNR